MTRDEVSVLMRLRWSDALTGDIEALIDVIWLLGIERRMMGLS